MAAVAEDAREAVIQSPALHDFTKQRDDKWFGDAIQTHDAVRIVGQCFQR